MSTGHLALFDQNSTSKTYGVAIRNGTNGNGTEGYPFTIESNSPALGGTAGDMEVIISNTGEIYADGTFHGGGAKYGEYFEKEEEIANGELVGLNLSTGKVRTWQEGDPFIGIKTDKAAFVGNVPDAETTKEQMQKTHALVAIAGQTEIPNKGVVKNNRRVSTKDGQFIGYELANGTVLLK